MMLRSRAMRSVVKLDLSRFDSLLESEMHQFAKKNATPLSRHTIVELTDPREASKVILQELPIRYAARIKDLNRLPKDVPEFVEVRDILVTSFKNLRTQDTVTRAGVSELKMRHQQVVPKLIKGMRQLKAENRCVEEKMNFFLNRFFLSRIGTEMLTSQYLALESPQKGILQETNPVMVCELALNAISNLTKESKGIDVPSTIRYFGPENATLSYCPSYLFYILSELLKNSYRAHCEFDGKGVSPDNFDPKTEPVEVVVCADEGRFAITVSDRGGGIPFEIQARIWSYLFSTCKETPSLEPTQATPLGGFGVGLPLARLYAEYLGGSLRIISLPNYGTHAYLFLNRSTEVEESLPS